MYRTAGTLLTASIVRYVGQLAIFATIAQILGPMDAGSYALAIAITSPVFILAGLGMRSVYLTLRSPVAATSFEGLRTVTVSLAIVASVVLAISLQPKFTVIVVLVAASKSVDAYNDLYGAVLQKAMRADLTVRTSIVCAVAQAGALVIPLVMGASLGLGLLTSTIAYALATLTFVRGIALGSVREEGLRGNAVRRPWVEILRAGFPTGISFGLITLLSTMPQYFLGWEGGHEAVGKYATLMYLIVVEEMVLNALSQSWIPHGRQLAEEHTLNARTILGTAAKWALITVPLSALAITVAIFVFPILFGPTYAISLGDLSPLACAIIVTPLVYATSTSLAIENRYRFSLVVSAIAVLLGAVAGFYLVRWYGLHGGLWAYAISLGVRAAGGLAFVAWDHIAFKGRG